MNDFEKACAEVDNYTSSNMQENVIEWVNNDTATVNLVSYSRLAGRVRKLAETNDDVKIISDNGGVLLAHIPVKFIKINPPKNVSEEQRLAAAERLKKIMASKVQE